MSIATSAAQSGNNRGRPESPLPKQISEASVQRACEMVTEMCVNVDDPNAPVTITIKVPYWLRELVSLVAKQNGGASTKTLLLYLISNAGIPISKKDFEGFKP